MKRPSIRIPFLVYVAASGLLATAWGQVAIPTVDPVEIAFEFIHDSIVVQATVNGHGPYSMLLDTGADPSIVNLETAKNIGLNLSADGQQGSGGGTGINLAYATELPVVTLGQLTADHVEALGLDLSKLTAALGRPIGGVLGYSLLKNRIVQIDYPHRKVRFYQTVPACAATISKCTTLSFRYQDDILATGVSVNGKRVSTNFDTGSNSKFQFTPAAVSKLGLLKELEHAHASSSSGFNGELKNREGTVRNLSLGSIAVKQPTVVFYGKGMGMDKEAWDVRIGNGFLKDFVVTFDFQHGRITLASPDH